jgi:hypothetical protein
MEDFESLQFESLQAAIKLLTDKRRDLSGPESYVAWLILDSAAMRLQAEARRTAPYRPKRLPPPEAPRCWLVGRRSTDLPGVAVSVRQPLADPRVGDREAVEHGPQKYVK